jgi:acetylornithine deacetylase/succinyl-diaminopimelate desuccinylase-like protein
MTRTEKLLGEIIALPSVNPAFVPGRNPHGGEGRLAEFLAATAAGEGLEVELRKVAPGRPNVLAWLAPSGKPRQTVALVPHLDTVNADDEGFVPRRRGGRMYGRGACDTKGSIAAMLRALFEVAKSGRRPRETAIVFAGVVDEENGQAGSRALVKSGFRADLAIVGEPTELRVVTAHKGDLWLELETRGKSAHGARPELGQNAVHEMARIVDALETDYRDELQNKRRHPLLGTATASVGVIRGGTQPNIVPDRCTMTLDCRNLPGETEASVRREISGFLKRHRLQARFHDAKPAPCLPMETDASRPLVRKLLEVRGQRQPAGVDYFCDAAVLAAGGIPSVVFGPGDIAQAHTADEWISLDSLERSREILVNFLTSLP